MANKRHLHRSNHYLCSMISDACTIIVVESLGRFILDFKQDISMEIVRDRHLEAFS